MNRKELKAMLKSDKRTKEEVFQELVTQMKQMSKEEITDGEAAQAVRYFIGFCSALVYGDPAKSLDSMCSIVTLEDGADNGSGMS
jgi:hypothetical protein